jgi:L-alanine-DL-glutamate epimerase-like enolase superfamily enzyme
MLQIARAHKLDAMIGCMIESSLAITAAVHLQSLARWIDLDGCLLLKKDIYSGARLVEGRWHAPNTPGLGIKKIDI